MDRSARIAAIEELLRRVEATEVPRRCIDCRHSRGAEYSMLSKCMSPIAAVKHLQNRSGASTSDDWPTLNSMRAHSGLCGPESLLFEKRWFWEALMFWRQPTTARQMFWAIGEGVCAFGLFAAWVTH